MSRARSNNTAALSSFNWGECRSHANRCHPPVRLAGHDRAHPDPRISQRAPRTIRARACGYYYQRAVALQQYPRTGVRPGRGELLGPWSAGTGAAPALVGGAATRHWCDPRGPQAAARCFTGHGRRALRARAVCDAAHRGIKNRKYSRSQTYIGLWAASRVYSLHRMKPRLFSERFAGGTSGLFSASRAESRMGWFPGRLCAAAVGWFLPGRQHAEWAVLHSCDQRKWGGHDVPAPFRCPASAGTFTPAAHRGVSPERLRKRPRETW